MHVGNCRFSGDAQPIGIELKSFHRYSFTVAFIELVMGVSAMAIATTPDLMTTEELLALPDDGMERWLIRGELRERPMSVRNQFHSGIMARVSQLLNNWLDRQPEPRGKILCGDAGVRLRRDPDVTVGIDIAYISAEVIRNQSAESTLVAGVPTLVVEVLSPNDTVEEINEKIDVYLKAGVSLIWIINPRHRTIELFQPGAEPELVNIKQELIGDPQLPGFRIAAAQIFS